MKCDSCNSSDIFKVNAKSADRNIWRYKKFEVDGYLPKIPNITVGDYISAYFCLNCGKVQGKFPVKFPEESMPPCTCDMEDDFKYPCPLHDKDPE